MSDEAANEIGNNFEPVQINRHEFVLRKGMISDRYFFLESGLFRAYTENTNGEEVTTAFYKPGTAVFEPASYFKRIPSKENIQALTDCAAWNCKYENLQKLFHGLPEFREMGRAILVNGLIALKERTLGMINQTAEERYRQMLEEHPEIFQNASLKQIASYLGITDTSLSRIRRELSRH
jgi:CRP-like cAMP-binding protein